MNHPSQLAIAVSFAHLPFEIRFISFCLSFRASLDSFVSTSVEEEVCFTCFVDLPFRGMKLHDFAFPLTVFFCFSICQE